MNYLRKIQEILQINKYSLPVFYDDRNALYCATFFCKKNELITMKFADYAILYLSNKKTISNIDGLTTYFLNAYGNKNLENNFIDSVISKVSIFNNVYTANAGTHTSIHAIFSYFYPRYGLLIKTNKVNFKLIIKKFLGIKSNSKIEFHTDSYIELNKKFFFVKDSIRRACHIWVSCDHNDLFL
jgi:hypothetical protein